MVNTLALSNAQRLSNIGNFSLEMFQSVPEIPHTVIIWTKVSEDIELPLQAIRYCYRIEGVTEDDVYAALFMPRAPGVEPCDWEYIPETNTILTRNRLLAAGLKYRGRKVQFTNFVVGLVYSEVMEVLENRSVTILKNFLEMLKQGVYFCFSRCTMDDGIEALSRSIEKGGVGYQNDFISCKSFRIALELVNLTGRAPILVPQNQALSFA